MDGPRPGLSLFSAPHRSPWRRADRPAPRYAAPVPGEPTLPPDVDLLARVFAGLDALVMVRTPSGFRPVSAPPAWAGGFPELAGPIEADALMGAMPFLSVFMFDAEARWAEGDGPASSLPLHSDPWTQHDSHGRELELEARALSCAGAAVLIIARTGAAAAWRQQAQQQANVAALRHEADVKLQRALRELADAKARAAEAEKAASDAKSSFLANMSHELRTPLNAIILYSDLIKDEAEDRRLAQLLSDVGKIKSASAHLLGLINTVLDLSKVEAGKMELHLESFDPAQLAREVGDTVTPLAQKNGNRLQLELDPALVPMHADITKTRQILFNLLSNACKFTKDGVITLAIRPRPGADDVEFRVRDTGIGMTAEQLAKMFKPFQQADASTSRKYGGTGLGLALCKQFCELMGGAISVESQPGAGTTFIAVLPQRVQPPPPQPTTPPPKSPPEPPVA